MPTRPRVLPKAKPPRERGWSRSAICVATLLLPSLVPKLASASRDPSPEQTKFFESHVRPVLEQNCVGCHGSQKQKGDLRLDTSAALLKGGKQGAVVDSVRPSDSRLLLAISYRDPDLQMPPDGPLPADQAQALAEWVRMGTPWPAGAELGRSASGLKGKHRVITSEDRAFWSFQPVQDPLPPALTGVDPRITGWVRNPVDRFIASKLVSEGLTPAPEADRATLIRRLTFDLHGLPPTPQEVAAFVNDPSPRAYEALVDRLLNSPRYGERWARHWLDLVRYAESDGFKQDAYRPNAWPYRDYVIRSFNEDKPYDRFVTEQLAGDEIAPGDPQVMVATGYLRAGTYEYNNRDVAKQWSQMLDDVTDVTGDALLGLSMGCARCHDHKFDPILQADYYRLRAFFAPMLPRNDLPLATPEDVAAHATAMRAWEEKAAPIREQLAAFEKSSPKKASLSAIKKFPEEMQAILLKHAADRSPYEEQLAELAMRQINDPSDAAPKKLTGADKEQYDSLLKKLGELSTDKPKPLMIGLLMTDVGPVAPATALPGDAGHPLEPGYLKVLDEQQQLSLPSVAASKETTGRRTALARWVTQPANPLTPRVAVNRIWQYHFGRGLVATSSDFGRLGTPPTHPELLDYLARRFVENGWSFKAMHRLILMSATYRQASVREMPETARLKDPENRWLWRMNTRRLDAEQVRDAMLQASGELLPRGPGAPSEQSAPVRTIYTKALRNTRDSLLDAFDAPESFNSVPVRNSTTTANQALLMINGDWPLKRAKALADRLYQQATARTPAALVDAAYRIAVGRPPTEAESKAAVTFLEAESRLNGATSVGAAGDSVPASLVGRNSGSGVDVPVTQTMPQRGGQAILVRSASPTDILRLPDAVSLGAGDFTIEAFAQLESVYDDSKVRVLAAEWDGDQKHAGWSMGVTGEKSKFRPRNLILQIASANGAYEVIASDFTVELHKAYYLAVAFSRTAGPGGRAAAEFYLKDLTDMDAPLKSAHVTHKPSGPQASGFPLTIGGRVATGGAVAGWDGLIDEVRMSRAVLTSDRLLYSDGDPGDVICGHWMLKERPGFFKDSAGRQKDLVGLKPKPKLDRSALGSPPAGFDAAVVDFCHVLLNSNEFLYVD